MPVLHSFPSNVPDSGLTELVQPSNWNGPHIVNVDLTTEVSGILPAANGGTGVDAATAPARQVLATNGSGFTLQDFLTDVSLQTSNAGGYTLSALHTGFLTNVPFFTLTPGAPPTGDLSNNVTIGGNYIYRSGGNAIAVADGGTGINSYAVGDLLYASGTTTLSKLAGVATGNALISGGVNTAPSWGKIGLTTHVSGILPGANGGTNNGFMEFSGPATSLKTFTLPNASATILTETQSTTAAPQFTRLGLGAATDANFPLVLANNGGQIQFRDLGGAEWHMQLQGSGLEDLGFSESAVADNRLVLKAGGQICLGTSTASRTLHISAGTPEIQMTNTASSSKQWHTGVNVNDYTLTETNVAVRMLLQAGGNIGINGSSFGSGTGGVIFIGNRSAAPSSNPTGGGILYVESGALRYRGSSGTITTIANA